MRPIHIQFRKTGIGEMVLGAFDGKLCLLDFRYRRVRTSVDRRLCQGLGTTFLEKDDPVIEAAMGQLDEYLAGTRHDFDIPLQLVGSDFQLKVWDQLLDIPYGQRRTYGEVARTLGRDTAVRAVGSANGANALSVIVPCHRLVGAGGDLVGYGGGLSIKRRLLKLESESRLHV